MGSGAWDGEVGELLHAPVEYCRRCSVPSEMIVLHCSGCGDAYRLDCVWCLPLYPRPTEVAAMRFGDVWHVAEELRGRFDVPENAVFAGNRFDFDREWARRWLELAAVKIPDRTLPDDAVQRIDIVRTEIWGSSVFAPWVLWIVEAPNLPAAQLRELVSQRQADLNDLSVVPWLDMSRTGRTGRIGRRRLPRLPFRRR